MTVHPLTVIRAKLSSGFKGTRWNDKPTYYLNDISTDGAMYSSHHADEHGIKCEVLVNCEINVEDIPLPPEESSENKKCSENAKEEPEPYQSYLLGLLEKVDKQEASFKKQIYEKNDNLNIDTKESNATLSHASPNSYRNTRLSSCSQFPNLEYDYDPEIASFKNIFDSHCHLDRMFKWHRKDLNLPHLDPKRVGPQEEIPNINALRHLKSLQNPDCVFGTKFEGCISVCCDPELWQEAWFDWLIREPNVWLTYGCHPGKAGIFDSKHEKWLINKLSHPRVVALGEIGLDETFYGKVSKQAQIRVFKLQLKIAKSEQLPICIHLRGDVIREAETVLEQSGLPFDWNIHMHCFTYSVAIMERWKDRWRNMKFGLTPNYFNIEVAQCIDLDKLLLETDAPYFVPVMFKKHRIKDSCITDKTLVSNCNERLFDKQVLKCTEDLSDGSISIKNVDAETNRINLKSKMNQNSAPSYKIGVPGMVFHTAQQVAVLRGVSVDQILAKNRQNIEDCYGLTPEMIIEEERKSIQESSDKTVRMIEVLENSNASSGLEHSSTISTGTVPENTLINVKSCEKYIEHRGEQDTVSSGKHHNIFSQRCKNQFTEGKQTLVANPKLVKSTQILPKKESLKIRQDLFDKCRVPNSLCLMNHCTGLKHVTTHEDEYKKQFKITRCTITDPLYAEHTENLFKEGKQKSSEDFIIEDSAAVAAIVPYVNHSVVDANLIQSDHQNDCQIKITRCAVNQHNTSI